MKRKIILFLSLLPVFLLSAGGNGETAPAGGTQGGGAAEFRPFTVTDSLGREVLFERPVRRVVTLVPHANEALKVLDCWDLVVGRDQWAEDTAVYPNILEIPVVTSGVYGAVDYELVFTLEPDLFLIAANPGIDAAGIIEKLSPEIPVLVMELANLETLTAAVDTLAAVFGKEERAAAYKDYVQEIRRLVASRTEGLSEEEKPRVFFKIEGWTFEQFCTLTNRSELVKSTLLAAGGRNAAADLPGEWIERVDPEWLADQEIDMVLSSVSKNILPGMWGYGVRGADKAEAEQRRLISLDSLRTSRGAKQGRVYLMSTEIAGSVQAPVAMLYTAKWMHPRRFEDVDPRAYQKRFMEEFLGLPPDTEGFFFYPVE